MQCESYALQTLDKTKSLHFPHHILALSTMIQFFDEVGFLLSKLDPKGYLYPWEWTGWFTDSP